MIRVSFFDASPCADYAALGTYDVPALPNPGHLLVFEGVTYEVIEVGHWPARGFVYVYVKEVRKKKRGLFS